MTRSINLFLNHVHDCLLDQKKIFIGLSPTNKVYRTNEKTENAKLSKIFEALLDDIRSWIEKYPTYSNYHLKERIGLLRNIKQTSSDLCDQYQRDSNGPLNTICSFFSNHHSDKLESSLRRAIVAHCNLAEEIDRAIDRSSSLQDTVSSKRDEIYSYPPDELVPLDDEDLLERATLIYELVRDPANLGWTQERLKELYTIYKLILDGVKEKKYSFSDVLSLSNILDDCCSSLGQNLIMTTFKMEGSSSKCVLNTLLFRAKYDLFTDILEHGSYDLGDNCYTLPEEAYFTLSIALEHLENKKIANIDTDYPIHFSTEVLLELMNYKYFQNSRSFFDACFKIINQRNLGIKLRNLEHGIEVELCSSNSNAIEILENPAIRGGTTHLFLKGFKGLFGRPIEADQEFYRLIDLFPNLEHLSLPLICGISGKAFNSLRNRKTFKSVELDCTRCTSFEHFINAVPDLIKAFNDGLWAVTLKNISHLNGNAFAKILLYFPGCRAISLDSLNWVSNELLIKICKGKPKLHTLSLKGYHEIEDTGLCSLANELERVTHLSLSGSSFMTGDGIAAILQKHGDSLEYLDLEDCPLNDEIFTLIHTRCKNLQYLSLKKSRALKDDHLRKIAEGCPKITRLDISGCTINNETIKSLIEICPNLAKIKLIGTNAGGEPLLNLALNHAKIVL